MSEPGRDLDPLAFQLGSAQRRNVDENPERSDMWALRSSRTRAVLPPLSQLTTGDPTRLQRRLTAARRTATVVRYTKAYIYLYILELSSLTLILDLTRFHVFVVLYLLYRIYTV